VQDGALVGRTQYVQPLCAALEAARAGVGGQRLALVGDPGAGKSTLLGRAVAEAEATGMAVVSVGGSVAERDLPLSGFHLVAGRTQPVWSSLPLASAGTLEAAIHAGSTRPELDDYALGMALLDAVAAMARDRPLLVAVDDFGWFDARSRAALLIACRRLVAEPVAVLVAIRPADAALPTGFTSVEVGGLDLDEAIELVRRHVGREVDASVVQQIVDAVGGNPRALMQASARLLPDQLTGDRPLPPTLSIGASLADALLERAGALGPDERLALAVVAAAGDAGELVAPALAVLGLGTVPLDRAVDAGLVSQGERGFGFVRPIMAAASVEAIAASDRRRIHAALAEVCTGDVVRRVSHLAGSGTGPSDELGDQLWGIAEETGRSTGVTAAAPLFREAAWSTPPGPERGRRLLRAGEAFSSAGERESALRCWRAAGEHANDDRTRTEAELLELRSFVWSPGMAGVVERARALGDRCAPDGPVWAIHAYVSGLLAAIGVGDLHEVARFVADIEGLQAGSGSTMGSAMEAVLLRAKLIGGERRLVEADVSRSAEEHVAHLVGDGPVGAEAIDVACNLPQSLLWCERHDEAEVVADAVAGRLRSAGSVRPLAYLYAGRCELHGWRGELEQAVAMGEMALDLARETDRPALAAYTGAVLARALAWRGAEPAVAELLVECAKTADEMGLMPARLYLAAAAGAVAVTFERYHDAVTVLAGAAALSDRMGLVEITVVPFEPDYIEALARCGERDKARARLHQLDARVASLGSRWGAASVERLRGLLDGDEDAYSLASKELTAFPFDRARALLGWGELLRSRGQVRACRAPLLEAVATFDALGAPPWAARARRELVGSGFVPTDGSVDQWSALTKQERQVAFAVLDGLSNREVADALFVSRKTVEFHLTRVFRKLGVRSRVQLVRQFAQQAAADAGPPATDPGPP
jgi:DNA-binding CsgD family transcriptional regulator